MNLHNRPLMIFDGNCQGQHLAAIMSASGIADAYAIGGDLGFVPSHLGMPCQYVSEEKALELIVAAKTAGRYCIQATQTTPMSDETVTIYTPIVDRIIRFPHLQMYSICMSEAVSKFGSHVTPRRMLAMDYSIVEACQKRANTSIDFAGFMRENAPKKPLFHIALHPSGDLLSMLLLSIAENLSGIDQSFLLDAVAHVKRNEGINSVTCHPVSYDVMTLLGFEWGEEYEWYRTLLEWRSRHEWEEIINSEQFLRDIFWRDSQLWLSLTQAYTELGNFQRAESCLINLLNLSPGYLHPWLLGVQMYHKFGDESGVMALAHRADAFFRGQRVFYQIMGYLYLNTGKADKAERFARKYYELTPDRGDSLALLLKVLVRQNNIEEARNIYNFELATQSPQRISEIQTNLSISPEVIAAVVPRS